MKHKFKNLVTLKTIISLCILIGIIIACGKSQKETPQLDEKSKQEKSSTIDKTTETDEPESEVTHSDFTVGQRIKLGDNVLTVNSIRQCTSDNDFMQPDKGNKYIEADVMIENGGKEPISYNIWDFSLQDNEGFSYNSSFGGCNEPTLSAGTLQKGQKARGYISFEIPKENKAAQLTFTPDFWSREQIIVKVK